MQMLSNLHITFSQNPIVTTEHHPISACACNLFKMPVKNQAQYKRQYRLNKKRKRANNIRYAARRRAKRNAECQNTTTAPFFDCIKSNNVLSKDNISPIQGHHPNNEQYPIYDVASFHPYSQSINAISRDNLSLIEGHHQSSRRRAKKNAERQNTTTAPYFDCIKYDYNHYETIPLYYEPNSQSNNVLSKDNISPIQGHHPNNEQYPIYDVASFHPYSQSINAISRNNLSLIQGHHQNRVEHPDSQSINVLSKHNISRIQGHHPNYEQYPIYDVAAFHPDSQSINALSRDNISLIEGHHPNRALAANEKNDGSGNMKSKPLPIEPYFKMPPEEKTYWEKKCEDSLLINILTRKDFFKMPPEEKRYWQKKYDDLNIATINCYPKNVEAFTKLHDFDQMDKLVFLDEEQHQEEVMEHDCDRNTQTKIKDYITCEQKVHISCERKRSQTIRDSVLYGQNPSHKF